jgi:hypothetical protein
MTGDSVAEPFRGSWVPAKASCDSPLKLVIDAQVVTFVNGAQRAEFRSSSSASAAWAATSRT